MNATAYSTPASHKQKLSWSRPSGALIHNERWHAPYCKPHHQIPRYPENINQPQTQRVCQISTVTDVPSPHHTEGASQEHLTWTKQSCEQSWLLWDDVHQGSHCVDIHLHLLLVPVLHQHLCLRKASSSASSTGCYGNVYIRAVDCDSSCWLYRSINLLFLESFPWKQQHETKT